MHTPLDRAGNELVDASANGIEMVIKANEKLGDSCSPVELCLALDRAKV